MTTTTASLASQVEAILTEAAGLRAQGDRAGAERILMEHITVLLRDRSSYVSLGRGMGAVLGGVLGYVFTLVVPGGSLATMVGSLLGTGYVGERVGKYTGEKLSEDDYCDVLRRLHRALLLPGDGSTSTAADLRPFWKSLLVLETPLDLFAPRLEGSIVLHVWRSVRRLFGTDLFALAVEAAAPGTESFGTLRALGRVLLASTVRDADARRVADRLYLFLKEDPDVVRLLGTIYYVDMGFYDRLRARHRELFDEDVAELFERDLTLHPGEATAVRNLAQAWLEEGRRDADTVPVFKAAVAQSFEPRLEYSLALLEAVGDDHGALAGEQDALELVIDKGRDLVDAGRLSNERLGALLRIRALFIVSQGWRNEKSLQICRRVFRRYPDLAPVVLHLAGVYLPSTLKDEWRDDVVNAVFPLRGRLDGPTREALLGELRRRPDLPRDRLRLAGLLLELERPEEASTVLQKLRADHAGSMTPEERLESARLLAVASWHAGKMTRAWELFKAIALVEPSPRLLDDVFAFAVDLLTVHDRPTMARNAFILVRSCSPEHVHPEFGPLESYYRELRNVFDYYDEDSIRKLGGGGMAVIYEGAETTTGHVHVIKQLRTDLGTPTEIERFRRLFMSEIKAIRRLNESDHPGARHIVKLYYESADEESFSYSMERLDTILSDVLTERGPLPPDEALKLVRDIGLGLSCAHAEGVVHRDLNPRNVGFKDGTVKIFDFGTAHILRTTLHVRRNVEPPPGRDAEDVIIGTPSYMSPEQAAGRQFDERTDIFSLGCVAYELVVGEMAFPGRLGSQALTLDENLAATLRTRLGEHLDAPRADAVAAALAAHPQDRPATVDSLIALLAPPAA